MEFRQLVDYQFEITKEFTLEMYLELIKREVEDDE